MKRLIRLLSLSLAFVGTCAFANPKLIGTWHSVNTPGNALSGTIELRSDGSATLAPDGHETLKGTWEAKGNSLKLTMPPYGTSTMKWVLSKKGLMLTYDNGDKQTFQNLKEKK